MATIKVLVLLFAILVPSTIILAQEPSEPSGPPSLPDSAAAGGAIGHLRPKRFLQFTLCDHRKHGIAKCLSCTKARHCLFTDIAIVQQCGGDIPYCNNGWCSNIKGSLCTSSNSSSTNSTG